MCHYWKVWSKINHMPIVPWLYKVATVCNNLKGTQLCNLSQSTRCESQSESLLISLSELDPLLFS